MAVQKEWGIAGSIRAVKDVSAIATYEAVPCTGFEAAARFSYCSEVHDCRQTEKSSVPQRARRLSAENFSTRWRPLAEDASLGGDAIALDFIFNEDALR